VCVCVCVCVCAACYEMLNRAPELSDIPEHGSGPSGSVKYGEFLDWLNVTFSGTAAWNCITRMFVAMLTRARPLGLLPSQINLFHIFPHSFVIINFNFILAHTRWSGREADHSPPSSAEVKNAWSCASTPPYMFMAWCLIRQRTPLRGVVRG